MASGSLLKKLAILAVAVLISGEICFLLSRGRWHGNVRDDSISGQDYGLAMINGDSEAKSPSNRTPHLLSAAPPPASPDEGVSRWVELQTRLDKMTAVSQNSDIQRRGEWQKHQIDHYCHKYDLDKLRDTLPAEQDVFVHKKLYRHLIFDDKKKLLFCFIPKVGCTNMRIFFFLSQGIIPEHVLSVDISDSYLHQELEVNYLEGALGYASFLSSRLSDEQRLWRVKNYYKFTFVRNPLERLLSAYLDKMATPIPYNLRLNLNNYPMKLQQEILNATNNGLYSYRKGTFQLHMPFEEFIQWVIDTDQDMINEHYAPLIVNAQPCRIRYDFYGNFKLYDSEMGHLIKKLDANPKYFPTSATHKSGNKTEDLVHQYYSQLPEDLRQQLFHKFYQELDFYYHLYPEDSLSHVHTLGVQEEIPVHCSDCSQ